jgi:cation transport ATPase
MLKKVGHFFREYKQFGLVLLSILIGIGMYLAGFYTATRWFLSMVALLCALPLMWGMYKDLQTGKYGIDILAVTAIITAVLLKEYWAAIIIVFMLTGAGRKICRRRAAEWIC